jgi:hypothetical protein
MKCVPIDRYNPWLFQWLDDDLMIKGEAFGSTAWSDGHILCVGEPPCPITHQDKDFARVTTVANRETLLPLQPLGVFQDYLPLVLFDSGAVIQAKYFNLIRASWPDVVFFGDDLEKPLTAKAGGLPVAVIMPVRHMDREGVKAALLQSANAVMDQAPEASDQEYRNEAEEKTLDGQNN